MITARTNKVNDRPYDVSAFVCIASAGVLLSGILAPAPALGDMWFLGIGNDGYYTDVAGVYNAYAGLPNPHGTPIHSRLLSDHGGATIVSDIGWLRTNTRPGDFAILFYSGHGGTTYDYNYDEVAVWPRNSYDEIIGRSSSWITDDQLADALGGVNQAVPLIAIVDCCYAGGMVGGRDDLNSLSNVFVMMSSREDQVSYGGSPYSRFTGKLIDGISGSRPADVNHNGIITYSEWFAYARDHVSGQNPVFFDAGSFGSLAIIPVSEPATLVLLAAFAIGLLCWKNAQRVWRGNRGTMVVHGPTATVPRVCAVVRESTSPKRGEAATPYADVSQ